MLGTRLSPHLNCLPCKTPPSLASGSGLVQPTDSRWGREHPVGRSEYSAKSCPERWTVHARTGDHIKHAPQRRVWSHTSHEGPLCAEDTTGGWRTDMHGVRSASKAEGGERKRGENAEDVRGRHRCRQWGKTCGSQETVSPLSHWNRRSDGLRPFRNQGAAGSAKPP